MIEKYYSSSFYKYNKYQKNYFNMLGACCQSIMFDNNNILIVDKDNETMNMIKNIIDNNQIIKEVVEETKENKVIFKNKSVIEIVKEEYDSNKINEEDKRMFVIDELTKPFHNVK